MQMVVRLQIFRVVSQQQSAHVSGFTLSSPPQHIHGPSALCWISYVTPAMLDRVCHTPHVRMSRTVLLPPRQRTDWPSKPVSVAAVATTKSAPAVDTVLGGRTYTALPAPSSERVEHELVKPDRGSRVVVATGGSGGSGSRGDGDDGPPDERKAKQPVVAAEATRRTSARSQDTSGRRDRPSAKTAAPRTTTRRPPSGVATLFVPKEDTFTLQFIGAMGLMHAERRTVGDTTTTTATFTERLAYLMGLYTLCEEVGDGADVTYHLDTFEVEEEADPSSTVDFEKKYSGPTARDPAMAAAAATPATTADSDGDETKEDDCLHSAPRPPRDEATEDGGDAAATEVRHTVTVTEVVRDEGIQSRMHRPLCTPKTAASAAAFRYTPPPPTTDGAWRCTDMPNWGMPALTGQSAYAELTFAAAEMLVPLLQQLESTWRTSGQTAGTMEGLLVGLSSAPTPDQVAALRLQVGCVFAVMREACILAIKRLMRISVLGTGPSTASARVLSTPVDTVYLVWFVGVCQWAIHLSHAVGLSLRLLRMIEFYIGFNSEILVRLGNVGITDDAYGRQRMGVIQAAHEILVISSSMGSVANWLGSILDLLDRTGRVSIPDSMWEAASNLVDAIAVWSEEAQRAHFRWASVAIIEHPYSALWCRVRATADPSSESARNAAALSLASAAASPGGRVGPAVTLGDQFRHGGEPVSPLVGLMSTAAGVGGSLSSSSGSTAGGGAAISGIPAQAIAAVERDQVARLLVSRMAITTEKGTPVSITDILVGDTEMISPDTGEMSVESLLIRGRKGLRTLIDKGRRVTKAEAEKKQKGDDGGGKPRDALDSPAMYNRFFGPASRVMSNPIASLMRPPAGPAIWDWRMDSVATDVGHLCRAVLGNNQGYVLIQLERDGDTPTS